MRSSDIHVPHAPLTNGPRGRYNSSVKYSGFAPFIVSEEENASRKHMRAPRWAPLGNGYLQEVCI